MGQGKIKFTEMLVPLGATNRTGKFMEGPSFITIHETSLGINIEPAYKDIPHYINLVMNPPKSMEFIGYHYLVSHSEIVRLIPDNEYTCHAGSKEGNTKSIGIERIVNVNTDFIRAIEIQAMVSATLMEKYNIPLNNVVPHKFWNGKECPARLLAGMNGGWAGFLAQVSKFYEQKQFIYELL